MQTLGQKLEEARTKKGISIREASESIKVRTDFLLHFESDEFNFSLPDIYKRGFLKNYARFLDLDAEKIISDFEKVHKPGKKNAKRDAREYLGKIELNEDALGESSPPEKRMHQPPKFTQDNSATGSDTRRSPVKSVSSPSSETKRQQPQLGDTSNDNKELWVKLSIYIASGFIVLLLIGLLVSFLFKDNPNEAYASEQLQSAESIADQLLEPGNAPGAQSILPRQEAIYAIAKGDVTVMIRQEYDKKVLLKKRLRAGDSLRVMKQGPVKIYCSEASNFRIGKNGKEYKLGASGTAIATFN